MKQVNFEQTRRKILDYLISKEASITLANRKLANPEEHPKWIRDLAEKLGINFGYLVLGLEELCQDRVYSDTVGFPGAWDENASIEVYKCDGGYLVVEEWVNYPILDAVYRYVSMKEKAEEAVKDFYKKAIDKLMKIASSGGEESEEAEEIAKDLKERLIKGIKLGET